MEWNKKIKKRVNFDCIELRSETKVASDTIERLTVETFKVHYPKSSIKSNFKKQLNNIQSLILIVVVLELSFVYQQLTGNKQKEKT